MKAKDVIKMIEDAGWYPARQKGSHRQYKHKTKKGLVTIGAYKRLMKLLPEHRTAFASKRK